MRDNRDILDKLRWLSNDMEYMEVPGEWLLPVTEAHSIIVREREEIERLRADNQKAALEYLGQIGQLSDENTRLRAALENIQQARVLQGKEIVDAANEIENLRLALEVAANDLEDWGAYTKANNARAALEKK